MQAGICYQRDGEGKTKEILGSWCSKLKYFGKQEPCKSCYYLENGFSEIIYFHICCSNNWAWRPWLWAFGCLEKPRWLFLETRTKAWCKRKKRKVFLLLQKERQEKPREQMWPQFLPLLLALAWSRGMHWKTTTKPWHPWTNEPQTPLPYLLIYFMILIICASHGCLMNAFW